MKSDGDGYLVLRVAEGFLDLPHTVHAMALSAAGVPRGVTTIALPDGLSVNQWDLVWSGSAYVFACSALQPQSTLRKNQGSVWRTSISRDANVLSPPSRVETQGMSEVVLASNGTGALQVWAALPRARLAVRR